MKFCCVFFSSSLSTTNSSDGHTTTGGSGVGGGGEVRTWLDGLDSPLIQPDGADNKMLKLRFDVSQYAPEEIIVKTVDNKLQVNKKYLKIIQIEIIIFIVNPLSQI